MNILFIGLGKIGYNIASHLSKKKNITIYVYNRSNYKIKKWLQNNYGFEYEPKKKNLIKFDYIITCVTDDSSIDSIFLKRKLYKNIKNKGLIIDHSTISYEKTVEISKFFKQKNIYFYDCPVTGGEEASIKGSLSTMCGGHYELFHNIDKILNIYSKVTVYCGKSGMGTLNKLSNQILMCNLITLSESIKFNIKNKINLIKFFKITYEGSGSSWILKNRYKKFLDNDFKDFGYSISLFYKDLSYVIKRSNTLNLDLEVVKIVHKKLRPIAQSNKKNYDISYFMKKYSK